jgi:hypothetical protein
LLAQAQGILDQKAARHVISTWYLASSWGYWRPGGVIGS